MYVCTDVFSMLIAMSAFRIPKLIFIIFLGVLNFANPTIFRPEYESDTSLPPIQNSSNHTRQLVWYIYDGEKSNNSAESVNNYFKINLTTEVDQNPWTLYILEENKKNTIKRKQNDGTNFDHDYFNNIRYNLTIKTKKTDQVALYSNSDNDSSTNDEKRKSEIKCEEYGQAIGKKVWALPLVGIIPEGVPVGIGQNKCEGLHTPLIVGGTKTQPGEFPHMAALGWPSDEKVRYLCGGTLISDRWVLTASHCTHGPLGSPSIIRLGAYILTDDTSGEMIKIKRIQKHPAYKPPAMYADIALLELKIPVTFTDKIKPACLYVEYDTSPTQAWVTGWGVTQTGDDSSDILLKAHLDILDNLACARKHNRSIAVPRGIVPSMVCAGDLSGDWQSDTCQGDSGGPLQVIHPTVNCLYQLVGVTSFGKLCALRDFPGVYTRVSHYLDWIESIVWPEKA